MENTIAASIGIAASIATLVGSWCLAGRLYKRFFRKKGVNASQTWMMRMLGAFVAILILVLTQELSGTSTPSEAGFLFDALYNPLSMFFANRSIEDDLSAFASPCGVLCTVYTVYDGFLYIVAPVLTLTTFLSLVSRLFDRRMIRRRSRKSDVYIFSEANERFAAFATSIFEHYQDKPQNCLVIFADTNSDNAPGEILESQAICCEEPPSIIAKWIHASKNPDESRGSSESENPKAFFLFSKEDEVKNLDEGLDLADQLLPGNGKSSLYRPSNIYIFSSSEAAMHLIDARMNSVKDPKRFAIQRVDWRESAVELMLSRYPLFLTGTPNPFLVPGETSSCAHIYAENCELYERESRHIAIIGSTDFAYCYLKNAAWAGCLGDGMKVQIDVVAPKAHEIRDRLAFEAPGLLSESGLSIPAIAFRETSADADLACYLRSTAGDLTFILVDFGNELENTRMAMRIREISDQQLIRNQAASSPEHIHDCRPIICVVVGSSSLASLLDDLHAGKRSYDLCAVGSEEESFSYDSIFNPELDRYGKNVNRVYNGVYDEDDAQERNKRIITADSSYKQSEYNRQSSIASAIHLKYGLFIYCRSMILGQQGVARDNRAMACLKGLARQEKSMSGWGQLYARLASEAEDGPCHALLASYSDYISRALPKNDPRLAELALENWRCRMEHDRWSAYTYADGYEMARRDEVAVYLPLNVKCKADGSRSQGNRDDVAKLHNCLVPADSLPYVDREYEECNSDCDEQHYELNDLVIIRHTKEILCD